MHFGLDGRQGVTTVLSAASLISCLVLGPLLFHNILSAKVSQIAAMAIGGGSLALNIGGSFIDSPRLARKNLRERKIQILFMSFLSLSLAAIGGLAFGGIVPKIGLFIAMTTVGGLALLVSIAAILFLCCSSKMTIPFFKQKDRHSLTLPTAPLESSPEVDNSPPDPYAHTRAFLRRKLHS